METVVLARSLVDARLSTEECAREQGAMELPSDGTSIGKTGTTMSA
jgi:hypothetical protein